MNSLNQLLDKHIDWIENFLLDRLNDEELKQFQDLLLTNPAMQEELEIHQELFVGLKDLGPEWASDLSDPKPMGRTVNLSRFRFVGILFLVAFTYLTFIVGQSSINNNSDLHTSVVTAKKPVQNKAVNWVANSDYAYDDPIWLQPIPENENWRQYHPYESFYAQRA